MAACPTHEAVEDYDIKENTKQKMVFRKYPFIEWGVGLCFICAFAFCEYMICISNVEMGKDMFFHSWFVIFLMALLLFAGIYCFYDGEIESIILDKKSKTLMVRYTSILCKKRYYVHALKDISGIRACIRGRKGPAETEHYVLCIFTYSEDMVKVLFSKDPDRIKR